MSKTRKVTGVGWDVSAIGNGLFYPSQTAMSFQTYISCGCRCIEACIYACAHFTHMYMYIFVQNYE